MTPLLPALIEGGEEITKVVSSVLVPHSLPEVSVTVCAPTDEKLTLPGVAEVDVAGVPPLKLQEYVKALFAQLVTVAVGVTVVGPQLPGIPAKEIVGLAFTKMVSINVKVLHLLV